ncbi:hypothetical protein P8C59_000840 [Phyllachora maydis]|uniref:F-box domain-containing protein n=1 Tax=Phyllachora maydis TaxID=1825666 RepID=A0AAD9HY34_9PEZI|nr:hypothetical protein P8C59_000840 [Phyllachora maydis]
MAFYQLPQELILDIVDHFADDVAALAQAGQINRAWHAACTRLLLTRHALRAVSWGARNGSLALIQRVVSQQAAGAGTNTTALLASRTPFFRSGAGCGSRTRRLPLPTLLHVACFHGYIDIRERVI